MAQLRLKAAAALALCRPDHRRRGLCRECRNRPDGRALGGVRCKWARQARFRRATTAHGALINHITGGHIETTDARGSSFQPMNVNFGLFPPIAAPRSAEGKRLPHAERAVARKQGYTRRALADFDAWLGNIPAIAAE